MPQRRAHVVEVIVLPADAHALLRRGRTFVRPFLAPEEHVLELVHPGVGEEQGGIVCGYERGAGHDRVCVLLEILEETAADVAGIHPVILADRPVCGRRAAPRTLQQGRNLGG